jgi:NADP-dependent 3-hydroxy acid dehydrogenase YdfG
MMPDIDKVVVVTGASSGIGESTANCWPDTERRSC